MKRILRKGFPYLLFFCISAMFFTVAARAQIDSGKTYVNLTKGISGGTVEPGDTLEIRTTLVIKSGTYDSCAFYDNISAGTAYIPGTLSVLTNEGKVYKSFTDAPGDDCGTITGGNSVTINLGFNPANAPATAFRRGRVKNTDRPSFYGGTCIMMATYRVVVTAALGNTLNLGGGRISFKPSGTPLRFQNFSPIFVAVSTNTSTCPNSIGANAILAEFGGTFGSGTAQNRGTSASVPVAEYTYATFTANSPQDYYYGVPNNTSSGSNFTTSNAWPIPDNSSPTHRVFTVWDIIGAHTGAVDPFMGNPPAAAGANAGYMLVVNAAYKTGNAFVYTVSNLCPNTYYELSAWIRNICSYCGCDSTGKGATSPGYIPTGPGDSSGVHPNLTLTIDGIDYYTTGFLSHTGQWVKKVFTYLTGAAQTSFTLSIRNNAPGGGGNDWAIDDISVATCTPNLILKPSPTVKVCYGNQVDMSAVISSYFSNYIYWQWDKSTDGGATWSGTGVSGTGTPVLNSSNWEYTANYPSFLGDSSQNNAKYRIKVASTATNLSNVNCSLAGTSTIQIYVNNCSQLLDTKLSWFSGRNEHDFASLAWTTQHETNTVTYDIERSNDGLQFTKTGKVAGTAGNGNDGSYTFNDPVSLKGAAYYRIKIEDKGNYKYSKTIVVNAGALSFEIKSLINPFDNSLTFDLVSPADKQVTIMLIDSYGKLVKQRRQQLTTGINRLTVNDQGLLSNGIYILRVQTNEGVINKRVVKVRK
jgi:hypothetical protein